MRLSLRIELIDCDNQNMKFCNIWQSTNSIRTEIVYGGDYYIGKLLSRRIIKYTLQTN